MILTKSKGVTLQQKCWTKAKCSSENPLGLLSLFLSCICCWSDCSGPAISSLAPVCFTCGCLTHHSRNGIMAWWQEGFNICGSISSYYNHQLITAHCGVMLTEGPRPPSEAHNLTVWRWQYTPVEDTTHWWTIKEDYRQSKTKLSLRSAGCQGNSVF